MGMTTKSGKYFANPAVGRAHERAEGEGGGKRKPETKRDGDESPEMPEMPTGGAHSVHIFKGEGGQHHVVAHHEHGPEFTEHGSMEEAMDHAKRAMGSNDGDEMPGQGGGDGGYGASALESTL